MRASVRPPCPRTLSAGSMSSDGPPMQENIVFKNSDLTDMRIWHGNCSAMSGNLIFTTASPETLMDTQISSKLAALAVALMMNSLIIGGVACLFNCQIQHNAAGVSLARASGHTADQAA